MSRRHDEPARSAHERLGEELVAAAVRRHEGQRTRGRVRWRAVLSITAAIVFGAGAVAGAARLIAVGEPLPDRTAEDGRYASANGELQLVAQAQDPVSRHPWGVGLYTNAAGEACALAGAVRGNVLGRIEGDTFRPYEQSYTGICGRLDGRNPLVMDFVRSPGPPPRTIVFGRARPGTRFVRLEHDGETRRVPLARGGFIAVFDGALTFADVRVTTE